MGRDKEVKLQLEVCETLQKKLGESVRKALSDKRSVEYFNNGSSLTNHSQIEDDIKRLRRELNVLSKMFGYNY